MSKNLQLWSDLYQQRAAGLPGHTIAGMAAMRQQAIDRFMSEGWPTPKIEAWHHTSLSPLAAQTFADGEAQPVAELVDKLKAGEEGHWLVFVDGSFDAALSTIGQLPAGVIATAVSKAWSTDADAIQAIYGAVEDGHSTSALNLALASDGAWIRLPQGAALEHDINVVCVAASPKAAHFLRHFIVAEAGAQGNIVEHYIAASPQASNLRHAVTRLHIDRDARVSHLKFQQEANTAWHLGEIESFQQHGSYFATHSISLGARLARNDISTHLNAERCETLLNGLYYADQRRHVDHHTLIDHDQPNCVSHELYRGILNDTAQAAFSGRILVAKGADGTDAIQRNDSLLLSRLAKSSSRPELEIYADDVKCTHGATVGQIDADSLFYLRSRGLDEAHARDILTYAFAAASVNRIESELLRRRVERAIRVILPGGDQEQAA